MTPSVGETPRSTALSAEFVATCSGLAALAHAGGADPIVLRWTAAVVVFLGAGFPILLRWSPREPSLLKLLIFSSLLSVPLIAVVGAMAHATVGSVLGWPVTFGLLALLQLGCMGRSIRIDSAGKAAAGVLVLSLLLAAGWSWLLVGQGNGIRMEAEGAIWQAGVARGFLRGGGLENPWLAGTILEHHPGSAALVAAVAGALRVAPTMASALLSTWCVVLVPLLLYLLAAPLWKEWRRTLLASALGLVGWNAWGVLRLGTGHLEAGVGLESTAGNTWRATHAALTPLGPFDEMHFGGSLFLPGEGGALGLVFVLGAWLASAHALRNGRRPWVGLAALCHGVAFCLYPLLGGCAALATGACAAVAQRPGRKRVLFYLGLAVLPGLFLVSRFGVALRPHPEGAQGSGNLASALFASLPLLLACVGLGSRGRSGGAATEAERRDQRLLLAWFFLCALLPMVAIQVAPRWAGPVLGRCSSLVLGVLAAGGLVSAWDRRGLWRLAAVILATIVIGGGGRAALRSGVDLLAWARHEVPVLEEGEQIAPAFPSEAEAPGDGTTSKIVLASRTEQAAARGARRRQLAEAYRWLREDFSLRDQDPVLVLAVGATAQGRVLPNPATLYADMPLWVDRWPESAPTSSRWQPRHTAIQAVFNESDGVTPKRLAELHTLGRPVVFLVTEENREQTRQFIERELTRSGAHECLRVGTVSLLCWTPAEADGKLGGDG
ncbi:MAG: hypothetical protein CMJ98_04820 [Planctomycetes bacterium]|nr:hypothetical protein [Planctomycetota bacterium]HJM57571.1 hypothetical protein [Planctomycetota bacterium]